MATKEEAAARQAAADGDDLRAQVDTLKQDLATLTQILKRLAGARGTEGIESLKSMAADAEKRAREVSAAFEGKVAERPLVSLLVAFGVGMVIGKLFERR